MKGWKKFKGYYYMPTTYRGKSCYAISNGITRLLLLNNNTPEDARLFISIYL